MKIKINAIYKKVNTYLHLAQVAIMTTWVGLPADLKQYVPAKVALGVIAAIGVCGIATNMVQKGGNNG